MGLLEAINRTLRLCACGVGSSQPQSSELFCRGVMRVQEGREALQCLQLGWVPVLRCDASLHTEASGGRTYLGAPWSHPQRGVPLPVPGFGCPRQAVGASIYWLLFGPSLGNWRSGKEGFSIGRNNPEEMETVRGDEGLHLLATSPHTPLP